MKKFLPLALLASIPAYALADADGAPDAVSTSTTVLGVGFVLLLLCYVAFFVWRAMRAARDEESRKD